MHTKLWATRLAEYNIGVFEIQPGVVETDMTAPVRGRYDALFAQGLTPFPRWGTPADVGKAVVAVAAGSFPYSTGMVIDVDGGSASAASDRRPPRPAAPAVSPGRGWRAAPGRGARPAGPRGPRRRGGARPPPGRGAAARPALQQATGGADARRSDPGPADAQAFDPVLPMLRTLPKRPTLEDRAEAGDAERGQGAPQGEDAARA